MAAITVQARDPNGIKIDAIVNGIAISNEKVSKTITVNTLIPIISGINSVWAGSFIVI